MKKNLFRTDKNGLWRMLAGSLILLFLPFSLLAAEFIPYEERTELQPNLEVVTPHLEFGRNLSGGPIKLFAVSGIIQGRDVTEIMERLDTKISLVSWDRQGDANAWGFGDFYYRFKPNDYKMLQKYVSNSLLGKEEFEVMLMCTPMGWNSFTKGTKKKILTRVEEGAGLIFVMPFPGGDKEGVEWDDELRKVCALTDSVSDYTAGGYYETNESRNSVKTRGKKWKLKGTHPITDGVSLDAMPFGNVQVMKYTPAEGAEVLIETEDGYPVMAVKKLGKGRVITFAFRSTCLTPPIMAADSERVTAYPHRYWEVWFDLIARSIHWASGREFKRNGDPVLLRTEGENTDEYIKVKQWKDTQGMVTDWQLDVTPSPVKTLIELSLPEIIDHGKDIPVSFAVPKGLENAKWKLSAGEPSLAGERVMESIDIPVPSGSQNYSVNFPGKKLTKTAATFHLTAEVNGLTVGAGIGSVLFTPSIAWDDFEIHCWGGAEGLPFLRDFERRLEKHLGVTCQQSEGNNEMKNALLKGYRNHLYAGIQGMHAQLPPGGLYGIKDKSLLIRKPSFTDREELAKRREDVMNRFSYLSKYKPLSSILADETSLTNYTTPFDYDFHPDNIIAFRKKLESRFKTVEAMNKALKTSFKGFNEVEPPTTPEAKGSGNWGLWNEWRAHNDDMWTAVFQNYGDWFNEVCPGIRLSLSGTQVSSPFNGIDWAKLTRAFRSIVGYRGRYQDLQRVNFDPTGNLKSLSWVGYGTKGISAHYQVWENLLTGDSGCGVFWWLSMRNPDLSWSKSALAYKTVFETVQRGIGKQYQLAARSFSPVAVLWSANSQRAAFTADKMDAFVKAEQEIMESLRAASFDPYFISEEQLVNGELKTKGAKALFLPMTLSLGMGEGPAGVKVWPAIKEFIDARGLVVRTVLPVQDEFLQPLSVPPEFTDKTLDLSLIKEKFSEELSARGIKPVVVVKNTDIKPDQKLKTFVHELTTEKKNKGYMVSFLFMPPDMKQTYGFDGVATWESASGKTEPVKLAADCSAIKYTSCYDRNKGKLLDTAGGTVQVEVMPGRGNILAFLPYIVKGITGSVKQADGFLAVNWSIDRERSDGETFAPHVMRVEVSDAATGKENLDLSKNITTGPDGRGEVNIPLSVTDSAGKWNITLTDMLTGIKTSIK